MLTTDMDIMDLFFLLAFHTELPRISRISITYLQKMGVSHFHHSSYIFVIYNVTSSLQESAEVESKFPSSESTYPSYRYV